jgi:predicted metal-dependent peptidase
MDEGHDLALIRGVVTDVCRAVGADVVFLAADTEVRAESSVNDGYELEMVGRGGTNMAKAIEHAEKLVPPVDVILVVTDGETPWPTREPSQKTIVCLVGESTRKTPPWAVTIRVDPDRERA